MRTKIVFAVAGLALAVSAAPTEAKMFRYAHMGDVNTLDPYSFDETNQLGYLGNVYEPLIGRSTPEMKLEPVLATEWSQAEPTRWRFKLRRGVKFHDGSDFKAEDVVFSVERAQQKTSQMGYRVAGVKAIAVDDYTVDMVTETASPLLINNFFYWYMMSKSWAQKNNAAVPGGLGSSGDAYANFNTNGTGPFKVVKREPDVQTVAEPHPGWWGEKKHNLTQVVYKVIKSDATRVAALLSGELELIYPVPLQDIDRVQRSQNVSVLSGPENRSLFLGMDMARDELLYSDVKGKNPFKDARVRKAVYQAIDIGGIIRTVLRNQGSPALGAALSPVVHGYPSHLKRHPYDADAAKKLLADAGYANGFAVTMDCPNDRYIKDEDICQAVVGMLAKVGIRVTLNAQTKGKHFPKVTTATSYDTSFALVGFGPGNFDASSIQQLILNCRGKDQGLWNFAGHCNSDMDAIFRKLVTESDPKVRDPLIKQVWDKVHEDAIYIPLHLQNLAWGLRKGVKAVQRPDDVVVLNHVTVE